MTFTRVMTPFLGLDSLLEPEFCGRWLDNSQEDLGVPGALRGGSR
jgi:hypothetical protein